MIIDDTTQAGRAESDAMADRFRRLRVERFGDGRGGVVAVARRLGIPEGTWRNYERGVVMPAALALRFIEATGADPAWLLRGTGPKYRDDDLVGAPGTARE